MNKEKPTNDRRERSPVAKPERRPFVKPSLERRSKLPKVTNGLAGTFEP